MKKIIASFALALVTASVLFANVTLAEDTPERNFEYYCHEPYWDDDERDYMCSKYFYDVWEYYEFDEVGWLVDRDPNLSYDETIYTYEGEYFTFHYTDYLWDQLTGEKELGYGVTADIYRVDGDKNLIPDVIDDMEAELEDAREYVLDTLGFEPDQMPYPIHVYLDDYGFTDANYTTDLLSESRRYPEGGPYMIFDPYDEDFAYTAPYEFFHTLLLSYDDDADPFYDVKFAEASAMWLKDQIKSNGEDHINRVTQYMENPHYSVFDSAQPEDADLLVYGTSVWAEYLANELGEEVIREVWEYYFSGNFDEYEAGEVRIYEAMSEVMIKEHQKYLNNVYFDYLRTVYLEGDTSFFQGLAEINTIDEYRDYPIEDFVPEDLPYFYGVNVYEFWPEFSSLSYENLVVEIEDGGSESGWEIRFIGEKSNGSNEKMITKTIEIEPGDGDGVSVIRNVWNDYEKITMMVVPMGSDQFENNSEPFPYTFSAYIYGNTELEENYAGIIAGFADGEVDAREVFSDIEEEDTNQDAIGYLYGQGVIEGYDDGTFRPENSVNRAELLKILVEGQGITPDVDDYNNCFPDVTDDWYAPYVCYALEQEWVSGYPDGTFKPADTVNAVEALKMLILSQGEEKYTPITDEDAPWYETYVLYAEDKNLLEEELSPDGDMNRGGICENLYRLLTVLETGVDAFTE